MQVEFSCSNTAAIDNSSNKVIIVKGDMCYQGHISFISISTVKLLFDLSKKGNLEGKGKFRVAHEIS